VNAVWRVCAPLRHSAYCVPCAVNCCDVTESSVKLETKSLKLNERGRLLVSEFNCSTVKVKDQNKQTIFESCMMIQEKRLSYLCFHFA